MSHCSAETTFNQVLKRRSVLQSEVLVIRQLFLGYPPPRKKNSTTFRKNSDGYVVRKGFTFQVLFSQERTNC